MRCVWRPLSQLVFLDLISGFVSCEGVNLLANLPFPGFLAIFFCFLREMVGSNVEFMIVITANIWRCSGWILRVMGVDVDFRIDGEMRIMVMDRSVERFLGLNTFRCSR